MTFWNHLDELRYLIFRVLGVWLVIAIVFFIAMPWIFDQVILAPCNNDFISYQGLRWLGEKLDLSGPFFTEVFSLKLVNINLITPFMVHISTSFWLSVIVSAPFLIYQIWRFIKPALFVEEQRKIRKVLIFCTVMFFAGVSLGYFVIFPLTLRFLSSYELSAAIENHLTLTSYVENFMMLILCIGLAFELPLLIWLLSMIGVLRKSTLKKYRRHALLAIVVLSAIITPTGDPFTLDVVAIPLYFLYELSIVMIKEKDNSENEMIENTEDLEFLTFLVQIVKRHYSYSVFCIGC